MVRKDPGNGQGMKAGKQGALANGNKEEPWREKTRPMPGNPPVTPPATLVYKFLRSKALILVFVYSYFHTAVLFYVRAAVMSIGLSFYRSYE
jgi:hypothetical protein